MSHHSDRGSQYLSIRYSERLAEAGIGPSIGNRGDSHDKALAETIGGLYKAELIHRRTIYIPPAEAEEKYYRRLETAEAEIALLKPTSLHDSRGGPKQEDM